MDPNRVTYFAQTDSRGKRVPFGIKAKDRTKHLYVIGKTGMGKSTLLENMAVQDIKNGEGFAFIDPHGKTAELLLDYIPENRLKDVLYFAPFDMEHPVSFNVMEDVGVDKRHLVANGLMSTFEKIWVDAWSARMAYILNNTLLALLEYPGATLLGVNKMLADKEFRKKVVDNVTDPSVKSFWVDEFGKYTEKFAAEATPAIQNKVGQFTSNPLIRNLIGQSKSSFDIRKIMDERKILIINLSKGKVGEGNANLIGSMLITKIYLAAMSRADISERELQKLPNFYLYVDEFQSFANKSFADILSEARKYKLNLTIAHQYIEQMEEEVRAAVFGNVGTMITFRVGAYDAEILEKEFAPQFTAEDLVNLGFAQIYLKLMIDGVSSQPFSATTIGPIKPNDISLRNEVIKSSRDQFARPRSQVEAEIAEWMHGKKAEPAKSAMAPGVPSPIPKPVGPISASVPPRPSVAPVPTQSGASVVSKPIVASTPVPPATAVVREVRKDIPPVPPIQPSTPRDIRDQKEHKPFGNLKAELAKVLEKKAPGVGATASSPAPASPISPHVQLPVEKKEIKPAPISLSQLKPTSIEKKEIRPEADKNALKNALADLVTKPVATQVKTAALHTQSAPTPKSEHKEPSRPVSPTPPVAEKKKVAEVPEDILRSVLGVEK
jgi:tRNA isopentenyl-2-thiomethyl-A-37 hydroxylase MiaE